MSTSEPVTPVQGYPAYVEPPRRRRGPSAGGVVLSLLAAVLVGAVVGFLLLDRGDGDQPSAGATPTPTQAADVPIEPASVESFDPVGGSGLRDEGDGTWSTQTYTTAQFGALKPGVGLVLDLGEARAVSTVTIDSASPGLAVELLAGDAAPSGDVSGLTPASSATTGDGPTELSGTDAGAHRYWMVWVTGLAPSDGGFSATISTPTLAGPPA